MVIPRFAAIKPTGGDGVELPKRKKIRLKRYAYSRNGAYFVTVCVVGRNALLMENVGADSIRPNEPILSEYGIIVETAIKAIPVHYQNVVVDKYCIMPDHIHMIVFIIPDEESGRMISAPTVSTAIGQMKRWVSRQLGFSIWQKSFHDRIIRNEKEYQETWQYIDTNPIKWKEECCSESG